MSDGQPTTPVVSEKWEMTQRLERIAEPLTGKRKIQFVDAKRERLKKVGGGCVLNHKRGDQ